ncbi:acetyl-CoA synthetase-like protein [Exidia glandulosa HHB12029]|uniref:Acetyl-CoA synthetase-like protein n=1 Tax=Exidia glandulosa HHB12029 TaxID=1314781 RepID=A0A165MM51_EXIGL|nr:acetyl-CoA synthetase-like protein [Exidia glandulosa HHB12029]
MQNNNNNNFSHTGSTFIAPKVKTQQCVKDDTFTAPPLDGSCTLPEAIDWHAAHSPAHAMYTYPVDDSNELRVLTWGEYARAIYRVSHLALARVAEKPKFAVLAVADSITLTTIIMGLVRAGYAPFVPSPRVSPQVLAQLLDASGVTHVIHSADATTTALLRDGTAHRDFKLITLPTFEDLYDESKLVDAPAVVKPGMYDVAVMIHSSGSTSIPKFMPLSHSTFMLMGIAPWGEDTDVGSMTMNFSALPTFHIMGLAQLAWATYTGARIAVFPPRTPPVLVRAETVLQNVVQTKSNFILVMPSLLEAVSHNPQDVEKLLPLDAVVYGGAALKRSAGEALVAAGVKLICLWGMSEMGFGSAVLSKLPPKDWQWVYMASFMNADFRDLGDGTHELMVISHDGHYIDRPNLEINTHPALATNDIVARHPTNPMMFRIVGRLDDQLVHSTGEKTNANPLEAILASHPLVSYAVVFGRGRPQCGALIMPDPQHAFDPSDRRKLAEFREAIWPTVIKMNEFAPSHSRIVKEMIIVASPAKPFAINPVKNTAVRPQVTAAYAKEIDAAYEDFENNIHDDFVAPSSWELDDALQFVRVVVRSTLPDIEGDEDDFFNFGCDSLKAARIHNNITNVLRATCELEHKLPGDIPYKYPTIETLAKFVSAVGLKKWTGGDSKVEEIAELVAKYTESFPEHHASAASHVGKGLVFLVTGTTGGLGTNLLAQLLDAPYVNKVYALNRSGHAGSSLLERHKASFIDRGVDPQLLQSDKFILLEGDTTREDLGISSTLFEEMTGTLTHIIHNAWPVNFNYSVKTFEPAIKGVKNLVDLALKSTLPSPPHFTFISSIAVTRMQGVLAPEEQILNPASIADQGYAQSKWISERLLDMVSKRTPLKTLAVRVGQLAGGSSGCWNVTDWVPVIARSAAGLGCLPDCDTDVFWMRLDEGAASLIDMRDATGILHLVHPRPTPWRSVFKVFSRQLGVPIVPYNEWLERLVALGEADAEGGRLVPALRLLEFYKSLGEGGFRSMSQMENISISKAREASVTLSNMDALNEADVEKWLAYWKRAGVLA